MTTWQNTNGIRVQKRYTWTSDDRGHYNYVLQQAWLSSDGEIEWRDVPVIDENGKESDYD